MSKVAVEEEFMKLLLESGTTREQLQWILDAPDRDTRARELCDRINDLAKTVMRPRTASK